MNSIKIWGLGIIVVFGLFILTSMAQAHHHTFQVVGCGSAKRIMLLENNQLKIFGLMGKGDAWSTTGNTVFEDMAWDFIATVRVMDGKTIGIGYYKFTDLDGDYFILEATGDAILEGGNWNFVDGTGKWEASVARLRGRVALRGRPLAVETEKYWCRIIGTLELPD